MPSISYSLSYDQHEDEPGATYEENDDSSVSETERRTIPIDPSGSNLDNASTEPPTEGWSVEAVSE